MRPRLASIDRFVDSIADRKIRPMQSFATADINDVRICSRHGDRADRRRRLIVKDWLPRAAVVGGLKNAAVHRRHVKDIRLRRNACDRASASAAIRSDVPPAQNGIEISRTRLPGSENNERDCKCGPNKMPLLHGRCRFGVPTYVANTSLFTT